MYLNIKFMYLNYVPITLNEILAFSMVYLINVNRFYVNQDEGDVYEIPTKSQTH